jgi:pilus assembly protein CpaB
MKQRRFVLILLLALVFGGLAGLLALRFLSEQARPLMATEAPRGRMVVAVADLPLGRVLRAEDVRTIDWHSSALPEGYYASAAEVIGRGLITPVSANEPLMASKLADMESGGGLPIVIPEGMRALSVRVDEVIGVAGFVMPSTRVDVLLTYTPRNEQEAITRIILQNIQTLASGQTIQRDANGSPQTVSVVTLLVNPEEAERLTLAANEGRIQLALRNTLDLSDAQTQGIRANSLISSTRAPAPTTGTAVRVAPPTSGTQSPTTSSAVVEVYRGGARTLETFQNRP